MSRRTPPVAATRFVPRTILLAVASSFLLAGAAHATPPRKVFSQCSKQIVAKCPKGQYPTCVLRDKKGCCVKTQCSDR
jgi:hypothetical protein